jgi:hypothetical protein
LDPCRGRCCAAGPFFSDAGVAEEAVAALYAPSPPRDQIPAHVRMPLLPID